MDSNFKNKLISGIAILSLIFVATGVKSATTANVTATVTVQNISVTVSDGSIAYGTLGNNSTRSTIASDLNDVQVVSNNGNITEDVNIRGQNSVNWTLAASAGSDQYVHRFCNSSCGTPPTNYTALTTNYQTLASGLAASATTTLNLQINTPNPSTVFTQQSVDVTIQAVAP